MKLLIVGAVAMLATVSVGAVPCRDVKGHFTKCPPAAAAASGGITKDAKGRCHAAGGKFVACPK